MICAGAAGCTADLFTFPLDTVKVWLQVRSKHSSSTSHLIKQRTDKFRNVNRSTQPVNPKIQFHTQRPSGVFQVLSAGVRKNGFSSLYGGISAGLQRQLAFCAVRIGFYDNVKAFYMDLFPSKSEGKQIPLRILAGTTTAFIAVAMFQPTEVVKIRMQAQARSAKIDRKYSSSIQAYRHLLKGGVSEAWRGLSANATRLAVVNVSELVTYDVVKELILDHKILNDTPVCHFVSAFISGFVTTLAASPIDVIKTRYMNSQKGYYSGIFDCIKSLYQKEGLPAFYKGFVPAYLRLGSWNIVMFVSYEQYKRIWNSYIE